MLMTHCVNDNDCTQLCVDTMWNNMSLVIVSMQSIVAIYDNSLTKVVTLRFEKAYLMLA